MEEFLKLKNIDHLVIEPSKDLANVCKEKGLKVLEKFLKDKEISL